MYHHITIMRPNSTQQSSSQSSRCHGINLDTRIETDDHVEGDHKELGAQTFGSQTRESSTSNINNSFEHIPNVCASNACVDKTSSISNEDKECVQCKTSNAPVCHIKLDQLEKLKNSTKKLFCLLEEVQEKTHSTALIPDDPPKMSNVLKPLTAWDSNNLMKQSVGAIIGSAAIKRLERQANDLDAIYIHDDDDDCSIHKRLTRKCHCLNQQEYNDFIIHFNEETKFGTTAIGEIIKNMRILKKFLYMGGKYTINSLLFLNQGLEEGSHADKVEIIQACAFADICCIFETHTIVTIHIFWPCKNPSNFEEPAIQDMAAGFLYNLTKLEEGRRYLNFNSKITCDIKKVIKNKKDKINYDTIELLNSVLSLLQPQNQSFAVNSLTLHCRPVQEDMGHKTLKALIAYRQFMTLNEIFSHLEVLQSLSGNDNTKLELTTHLPSILSLFKNMLLEFNDSDMNLIITNIMNNIVRQSPMKENEKTGTIIVGEKLTKLTSSTGTEPIKKKNVPIQVPVPPKNRHKKVEQNRFHPHSQRPISVMRLSTVSKPRQPSRPKNSIAQELNEISNAINKAIKRSPTSNAASRSKRGPSVQQLSKNPVDQPKCATAVYTAIIKKSKKFMGGDNRNVIVVPINEEESNKI